MQSNIVVFEGAMTLGCLKDSDSSTEEEVEARTSHLHAGIDAVCSELKEEIIRRINSSSGQVDMAKVDEEVAELRKVLWALSEEPHAVVTAYPGHRGDDYPFGLTTIIPLRHIDPRTDIASSGYKDRKIALKKLYNNSHAKTFDLRARTDSNRCPCPTDTDETDTVLRTTC